MKKLRFVFERDSTSSECVFLEVTDEEGNSVRVGEWSKSNGLEILTINLDDLTEP